MRNGLFMAITRNFRNTILKRAEKDAGFRRQMLIEAVNELLAGDLDTGKAILRDYINATITFEGLAKKIRKSGKSLHRMLGPVAIHGLTIFLRSLKYCSHTNI